MPGKFYSSPSNFPQSDLGRRADSSWALPQISSLLRFFAELHLVVTFLYVLFLSEIFLGLLY